MLSDEEKEKIRQQIRRDLELREQRDADELRRRAMHDTTSSGDMESIDDAQLKEAEIRKVKQEEENRFYRENPNYVQYIDRYGQKKWIHRKLFEEKRQKSIERSKARKEARWVEIRKYILISAAVLLVIIAGWMIKRSLPTPILVVHSNVSDASIFIDNLLSSYVTPATIRKISPGKHKIAVYKAGFETKFVPVTIESSESTLVEINLDSLPPSELDLRYGYAANIESPPTTVTPRKREIKTPLVSSSPSTTPASPSRGRQTASVFITSNQTDANIYMDGNPISAEINKVIENIGLGSHTFEVKKPGYVSDPTYNLVNLRKSGELVSLSFELVRDIQTQINIRTEPVSGEIFLDGRSVTRGIYQEQIPAGNYKISFGEVPGYQTPKPQEITISELNPEATVVAIYIPNIYIEASLGDDGQLIRKGCSDVTVGYYLPDQGAVESFDYGPTIEKNKTQGMYYWEMGYAFSRRNPPGSDFIEIHFDLPPNFDKNDNIILELYGYGSHNNYLFHVTEGNELAVDINNKEVIPHIEPSTFIGEGQSIGVDSWQIKMHLRPGGNALRVRTTDKNHCFYYLRKIVIRSMSS
jgi:hypothetical protein